MSDEYWKEEANSLEIQCTELEEKIQELEQQNKEMFEVLKMISEYFDKGQHSNLCEAIFNNSIKQIIT